MSRRAGKRASALAATFCALALAAVSAATLPSLAVAVPRDARLRAVHSWAFAIGDGALAGKLASRYSRYDLLVLDGEGAGARQVRELRRAGKLVIAYLDVGTIEPARSWFSLLKPYRLEFWRDWGEWYADLSAAGFRRAVGQRIAPAILRKGFDGLFLDNVDMVQTHHRQAGGMRTLVRELAASVHRRRGLLFAQNGEDSIGPILRYLDGWNREDVTGTYDFGRHRYVVQTREQIVAAQAALRGIAARGLLVLSTDYVAASDRVTAGAALADACSAGALPFLSDISLTRVAAVPPRCPHKAGA